LITNLLMSVNNALIGG